MKCDVLWSFRGGGGAVSCVRCSSAAHIESRAPDSMKDALDDKGQVLGHMCLDITPTPECHIHSSLGDMALVTLPASTTPYRAMCSCEDLSISTDALWIVRESISCEIATKLRKRKEAARMGPGFSRVAFMCPGLQV